VKSLRTGEQQCFGGKKGPWSKRRRSFDKPIFNTRERPHDTLSAEEGKQERDRGWRKWDRRKKLGGPKGKG